MTMSAWRSVSGPAVTCGDPHDARGGFVDESVRRLSHAEYAVACLLASEGHGVFSLAERPGRGRTADLLMCGIPVEVKAWLDAQERRGRAPGIRSVVNKLRQAEGQAATVVLNGRGSGLSPATAHAGMAAYGARRHRGHLAAVRVLGDGFDLAWSRVRVRTRGGPDLGLGA